MPDVGAPDSPLLDPAATKTHTGTQQWQSFEIRMRRRRAERCRLRAEVAIDAGFLDDAEAALEEARQLQPDLLELLITDERLAGARLRELQPPPAVRRRIGAGGLAAAASLALVVGAASFVVSLVSGDTAPSAKWSPQTASSVVATALRQPATNTTAPELTGTRTPGVGATPIAQPVSVASAPPAQPDQQPERARGEWVPASGTVPALPIVTAAPLIVVPPPEPARPSDASASPPASPAPDGPVPVPPPSTALPAATPPSAGATSAPPTPDATARSESAAEATPEVRVRAALSRYEAAYSALNAAAARAIWPTVDASALGRAFDSLESQQISLGTCAIELAVNGQSARATCAGSATWTPKVGDGTRTEPRRWTFDLEPNGDRWQIVRATAR
jgi:hypothetical protein